ncbi:MAG: hypothetical protein WBD74_02365 [Candidatus Aquilonibacter sp.]
MTERARRTTIVSRFYSVMILVVVGGLYSNQFYVGYIPLPIPGFRDHVQGLMLGGMNEDAAVGEASRFSRLDPQIVGPIVGWAALRIAGVAFLFIVAVVVILPFFIHTTTRRN